MQSKYINCFYKFFNYLIIKPKQMSSICRDSINSCDLPEYCDGLNPVCPPDFFVQNGLKCPDDSNVC